MSINDLIEELQKAKGGDRFLDGPVAMAAGWTRQADVVQGENGQAQKRVVWLLPGGKQGRLAGFTDSLDAAILLVRMVAPSAVWGVSWANGRAMAIIGEGPYCEAATPALALCTAALRFKEARGE